LRLDTLRKMMSQQISVELVPVCSDWSLASLKEFCTDLIVGKPHPWEDQIRNSHIDKRSRMFVSASLFLFRKAIPAPPTPKSVLAEKQSSYQLKMMTPQAPPDQDILRFTRHILNYEFREGWDKGWEKACDGFTLPTSSCLESPASNGGARGLLGQKKCDCGAEDLRCHYYNFVMGEPIVLNNTTKLATVSTGGKDRIVSVFSAERSFLTPLHRILYSHLSRKEWLLRGEAEPCRFEKFLTVPGEVFVSGDYESASDNLNIHLSEFILDCIRSKSRYVPDNVWVEARKALRAEFVSGGTQERGQLMGSLLSFPLLCITNYLALRYFVRRSVPLKINGDDIVFRCTMDEYRTWSEGVESWGLTLSIGKTLVSETFFSLNSAFFLSGSDAVTSCPFIRSSCLFSAPETVHEVAGRIKSCVVAVRREVRFKAHRLVLQACRKAILGSQRSLSRGLLVSVSRRVIRDVRLGSWEKFYLSQPSEPALPPLWAGKKRCVFLDNWERVLSEDDQCDEFVEELIESCWGPMETRICDYWDRIRDHTLRYVPPCIWKYARMSGMTWGDYQEYLEEDRRFPRYLIPRGKMVWVRRDRVRELRFAIAKGDT